MRKETRRLNPAGSSLAFVGKRPATGAALLCCALNLRAGGGWPAAELTAHLLRWVYSYADSDPRKRPRKWMYPYAAKKTC
jgi:hypothetical protein